MVGQLVCVEAEAQRGDTLVEHLQRFLVGLARILACADVLTDVPLVVGTCTANVRELTGR